MTGPAPLVRARSQARPTLLDEHQASYVEGSLTIEGAHLATLAERCGTPSYVYSTRAFATALRSFQDALRQAMPEAPLTCFAVKANPNVAVLRLLGELGAGADIVSVGELRRARAAGIPPRRIVFSGVGKTAAEIEEALACGIGRFNVESAQELDALQGIAARLGKVAHASLRINPDIDAGTHAKITTGTADNKFGLSPREARSLFARAGAMDAVRLHGLGIHIGSQITRLDPYREAFRLLADLVGVLRAEGHAVDTLDLGGGLGIRYHAEDIGPDLAGYADLIATHVTPLGCAIIVEPGRLLAGNAGVLLTRVLYTKTSRSRSIVIVDAGMNDLLRPALYGSTHEIAAVREPEAATWLTTDVVGPVCESSDEFCSGRSLPPLGPGDLLAILSTGAYAASMGSTYNCRPLPPETLIADGAWTLVRPRGCEAGGYGRP